jgi:integrase/recombinase XerD
MQKQMQWSSARLVETYETSLQRVCGASQKSCYLYKQNVLRFLDAKYGEQLLDLSALHPMDLISFVTDYSSCYKPKTTRNLAAALRSFLRFLLANGLCDARLVEAVPTFIHHRLTGLPAVLSTEQVTRLLSSFNRSRPDGLKGYAMVCCMAYLGLRAGEVASLSLDNIDWRAATLQILKAKPRRPGILPLPKWVGQAIADYLQRGRPSTREGRIFVSHQRPVGKPISSSAVRIVVRRAFNRIKLDTPSKGTHILRHTMATHMIRKGASLKEIADVLRHRYLGTTLIYTKVDLPMLAGITLPWPEVKK